MTQEVAKIEPKMARVQDLLKKATPAIAQALPQQLTADKFMRIVLTSIRLNPKLADTTPASFISCVIQAAQLGLVPDGILGHAYLIPFHDNKKDLDICTLVPGYKGLVELALRSGSVSTIEAAVVFEKDSWTYERGLAPKLVHVPAEDLEPGEMRMAYAIATMKDGTKRAEVLFRRDVLRIKNFSQTGRKGFGPWKDWEEEMWKKTAIRRLCKLLPLSPEDRRIVEMDEAHDAGAPIDLSDVVDIPYALNTAIAEASGDLPQRKTRLDVAAEALRGVSADPGEPEPATPEADLDTKIAVLIDNIGEVRLAGWLWTVYGITRIEEIHKLKHESKVEMHRLLLAGEAVIDPDAPPPGSSAAKRMKTMRDARIAKGRAAGLFEENTPTPGTD